MRAGVMYLSERCTKPQLLVLAMLCCLLTSYLQQQLGCVP